MSKHYRLSAVLLGLLIIIAGCSSSGISYDSDYQQGTDFSKYKTYRWHAPNEHNKKSQNYLDNKITVGRIRGSIEQTLESKGYVLVLDGNVDFLVNYTVTTDDRVDVKSYNNYGGYAPGWGGGVSYGSGYHRSGVGYSLSYSSAPKTKATHYRQGTLVLDIIEPSTDKLVWRGSAEGKIKDGQSSAQRHELVKEAVMNLLQDFPPLES